MLRKLFERGGRWTMIVLVAVGLFLVVNFAVSPITGARVDLTQNKLFTLSEGTRKILAEIEEPVTLQFYFSKRLGNEIPVYGNHANRVRDMLREFESVAGDKLIFEEIDPTPFSEMEDQAVASGIQAVPYDQRGEKVYFGLTGTVAGRDASAAGRRTDLEETKTDRRVIPFFQLEREQFLEYDMARVIAALDAPRRPLVGVFTGRPMFGDPQAALAGQTIPNYMIVEHAQEVFDMKQVWGADTITDDLDLLVIAHPGGLTPQDNYAIDQYLMRNGKLLVFLDPFNEQGQRDTDAGRLQLRRSNLDAVMKTWGVDLPADKLVADINLARMVNAGEREGKVTPAPYVTSLRLGPENLSRTDPVTANIESIIMESAGYLVPTESATTTFEPLISSTDKSQVLDIKDHKGALDIQKMAAEFVPSGEIKVLAARITGPIKSAFPDGPPTGKDAAAAGGAPKTPQQQMLEQAEREVRAEMAAEQAAKNPPKPHLVESQGPVNIILVADADMLEDPAWIQTREFYGRRFGMPVAGNGDLMAAAMENLSGTTELMSLRSRGTAHRPFLVVDEMRRSADAQYRAEEQRLLQRMEEMETKLTELKQPGAAAAEGGDPAAAEQERQAEIATFTEELLATRKQLRDVQFKLRNEIDRLESWLEVVNIAAVPLLVALLALVLGWMRLRRRRRAVMQAA